jgi:26S proteasome regulatory subunit N2
LKSQAYTFQPTGGVILLNDTRPSEPKSLLELKVKKTAPAPTPGGAGPSGDQAPAGVQAAPASADVDDNLVEEGGEEASVPGEFEYNSDTGEGDDD